MKYRIARIPKRNGTFREIYIASNEDNIRLRGLIPELDKILSDNDTYKVNYSFQKGKNCALNALQHIGYRYTLSMDLENFFDTVTPKHVKKIIPNRIIKHCFIDGNPKQGLPTSPVIATIALLPTDEKIVETLAQLNISARYTRYADDLIFSFDESKDSEKIKIIVENIIEQRGFKVNKKKTRLQDSKNGRIIITGIAVDRMGLHATRHTKKKIRAASHQNNITSKRGLDEWSKCKLPTEI